MDELVSKHLHLPHQRNLEKLQILGTTQLNMKMENRRLIFLIRTLMTVFRLQSYYSTGMVLELEAGSKEEIISILRFSLFLIRLPTMLGRRLLDYE